MVVWTSLLTAFKEGEEGDEDEEFAASFKPLSGCNLRVIPRRFISSPSILVDGVRSPGDVVFWSFGHEMNSFGAKLIVKMKRKGV